MLETAAIPIPSKTVSEQYWRCKASRYNVFIPLKRDRFLVYNSFSRALAVLEQNEMKTYRNVVTKGLGNSRHSTIQQLAANGFLVADHFDELAAIEKIYKAERFNARSMILTIAPVMTCNFGCDYCYQGLDKPRGKMNSEVQDAILKLVELVSPQIQSLHVAWYGGEPLIGLDIIETLSRRLIAQCIEKSINYSAMMVSNGWLMVGDVAQRLVDCKIDTVQITLDGAETFHDERRYLLSGKPTFNRIVDNIRNVVDNVPINFSIRVNVDDRNQAGCEELLDTLKKRNLANRKNLRVYFAPVESMTKDCHDVASACMTKSDYAKLEAKFVRKGMEAGLTGTPYPSRFLGLCAAIRPLGFVVLPTGAIHKCWDTVSTPEHSIGNILELEQLKTNDLHRRWLMWTPFENESCRNCKLLPNCAGACAYKFIHREDTKGEAASLPCPSWKYNLNERLLLMAEQTKAVALEDYDAAQIITDPSKLCSDVATTAPEARPSMGATVR